MWNPLRGVHTERLACTSASQWKTVSCAVKMPLRFGILMFDELFDCSVTAMPLLEHQSNAGNDVQEPCGTHKSSCMQKALWRMPSCPPFRTGFQLFTSDRSFQELTRCALRFLAQASFVAGARLFNAALEKGS